MHTMTFEQAAFNTVADYPGGAKALGPVVGINGSVLAHKVSLTDHDNQLTVPQARKLMQATGDCRMLHSLAADLNHLCVQVSSMPQSGNLHRRIADTVREFGEFIAAVSEASDDNDVTPNEMRAIDKELGEMVARANALRAWCAKAAGTSGEVM
ncbi:MAG: phage regulatory CII family protein [Burkholderiaceae bacterium]